MSTVDYGLLAQIRSDVADELASLGTTSLSVADRREMARSVVLDRLRRLGADRVASGQTPPNALEEQELAQGVFDALFGLGRLQSLVDDSRIENIDVNGCESTWITYADGSK